MSVSANAHATRDAAHETFYTHDHAAHDTHTHAATPAEAKAFDASHADTCNQSHCGHSHTAVILTGPRSSVNTDTPAIFPANPTHWASSPTTNNIERPKWLVTTPAVVSLLS